MKHKIKLIWQSIAWSLGNKTATAPFMTLIYNVTNCNNCNHEFATGEHVYLTACFKELLDWKQYQESKRTPDDMITADTKTLIDPLVLCNTCYIAEARNEFIKKAFRAKQEGKPSDYMVKHTKQANRAIIADTDYENKILAILEKERAHSQTNT